MSRIELAFNPGQTAQDPFSCFKGLGKLFLDRCVNRSYNENGFNPYAGYGRWV